MSTHIALLRAINLGAKTSVPMAELRASVEALGFADVRTLLQSGNLVFDAKPADEAAVESALERGFEARFGFATDIPVRSAGEWAELISNNPFPEEAARDPAHLVLFALKRAPEEAAIASLRASIGGSEKVEARGRHLFIVYPDGIGRSKLTNAVIERHLGIRGTGRNWNTVLKIAVAAAG